MSTEKTPYDRFMEKEKPVSGEEVSFDDFTDIVKKIDRSIIETIHDRFESELLVQLIVEGANKAIFNVLTLAEESDDDLADHKRYMHSWVDHTMENVEQFWDFEKAIVLERASREGCK